MNNKRYDSHISYVYSLWQDLSYHTIILDLVNLTLKFDLLLKILTSAITYEPWDCSLWQDLSRHSIFFDLVTLKFDLLFKNCNLGHN